jgi:PAS domain S-box-containing protein
VAEEALRKREVQLEETQRLARVGSWELDLDSGRVTWSEEVFRLWGWEPGREISFYDFLSTLHVDDRAGLLERAAQLVQPGDSVALDYRALVADGRRRWFRARARLVADADGGPGTLVGSVQDVTEEKESEQELRTAKKLYQLILEMAHEGVFTVDAEGITTFANPSMAQILGYSVEEMCGMPASVFVSEEAQAALSGQRQRRRAGISQHYDTTLRAKDGATVRAVVSISPLNDEGGAVRGSARRGERATRG